MRSIGLFVLVVGCANAVMGSPSSASSSSSASLSATNYPYCHASHFAVRPSPSSSNEEAVADEAVTVSYPRPSAEDILHNVQVVFRHGARSPINLLHHDDSVYDQCHHSMFASLGPVPDPSSSTPLFRMYQQLPLSSSPLNPYTFHQRSWAGNCMPGQLTAKGIRQHVELGRALRSVYVNHLDFLNSAYDAESSLLFVRSTDYARTRQSAQALLTGLFGFELAESPDLAGTLPAIPIHTFASDFETMYGNSGACPRYAELVNNATASAPFQKHVQDNFDFLMHLARATNMELADKSWFSSFDHFFDQTHVRFCHNMALPCRNTTTAEYQSDFLHHNQVNALLDECVTVDDVKKLGELVEWEYRYLYQHFDQLNSARLGMGAFLNELHSVFLSHHRSAANPFKVKQSEGKLILYSGHDTTVGPLLAALNVSDWSVPSFASHLVFELWERPSSAQDTDNSKSTKSKGSSFWYVRVFLNGQLLQLPWCNSGSAECEFSTFSKYIANLIPHDFMKECGLAWR